MATAKTKAKKSSATPRRRRGVSLRPTDLAPTALALEVPPKEIEGLVAAVREDGGQVLSVYREPLGGNVLVFAALPVERVAPTPYQREVSDAHVRRLTVAMDKTKRFLDPIITIREQNQAEPGNGRYLTPNGNHRLTALKELGAKSVLALVVPEHTVAYQILALNIEKAYNLREKAIEVVRLHHELARLDTRPEETYALEFEEPALVTLGFAYEKRPRISGGAYHPVVRKVDAWIAGPIGEAAAEREQRAGAVLALDDAVGEAVERLKERGLKSPYLKAFVVARINPLRFIKGEPPPLLELLATMTRRARGMKADNVKAEDLARSGGPAPEEG